MTRDPDRPTDAEVIAHVTGERPDPRVEQMITRLIGDREPRPVSYGRIAAVLSPSITCVIILAALQLLMPRHPALYAATVIAACIGNAVIILRYGTVHR